MNKVVDNNQYMNTLVEQLNKAVRQGYNENFSVKANRLVIAGSEEGFSAEQTKICDFFRFEGLTDPQDSSILYLIETNAGVKGTLVDSYGVYADSKIATFIRAVDDIHKESNR